MTHETSRIPALIDALVSTLTTAVGTSANVVDGPPLSWAPVALAQDAVTETSYLFIGAEPDEDTSATGEQDFNAAGAVSRDEQLEVPCTAFVWTGDQVMKTVRDAAFALVGEVEQAIRADPSLADAVLYSRMAGVSSASQRQYEDGCSCTVIFTVAARGYLE